MNNRLKILTLAVFVIITCFFTWFLSNDIFSGDDIPALFQWLTEGGAFNTDGVISALITHFVGRDIPLLFHINPHLYSMTFGAFIRAFDIAVLCLIISSFAYIGRNKTFIFPLLALVSALYFCYACSNIDFVYPNSNNLPSSDLDGTFILLTEFAQHFGQLFNFILGLIFLYILIFHFCQNKIPSNKYNIPLIVLSVVTAMSSLFVNVICGVTFFAIILYLVFLQYRNHSCFIFDKFKPVVYPFVSYVIGSILFSFYPGYFNYFSLNSNFLSSLKTIIKFLISSNSLEFALILILSSSLYLLALNKSSYIKRTLFVVYSVITGCILYFALFLGLNEKITLFLTESLVLFRMILFVLIFFIVGGCFREHKSEPKELKILCALLSLILLAFSVVQIPFISSSMLIWRNMSSETKTTTYCLEKMYRFYSLLNKTAILPEDALVKIFKIDVYTNDKEVNSAENITNRTFFKHTFFTDGYYKTFYPKSNIVAYKFIDSKTALKIFFEEGGMIDANELKNLNFQNLYNDSFVLNRAVRKL